MGIILVREVSRTIFCACVEGNPRLGLMNILLRKKAEGSDVE
jgi:hypothetical protein